ncbi:MAG: NifU family protein [bacterium]
MKFRDNVIKVLEEARENLKKHGGGIELVDANEKTGIVKVRLEGACVGCPMSTFTMQLGIEKLLKERIPAVKEVVDETEYQLTLGDDDY